MVERGDLVVIKSRWTQQILTFRVTRVNEDEVSGKSNQSYAWEQHELLWINGCTIKDDPKLIEAICQKAEETGRHKWQS